MEEGYLCTCTQRRKINYEQQIFHKPVSENQGPAAHPAVPSPYPRSRVAHEDSKMVETTEMATKYLAQTMLSEPLLFTSSDIPSTFAPSS